MDKKLKGRKGEEIAAKFLVSNGYKIIETNFRTRNGEIDIVAIDKNEKPSVLVCVEVKLRRGALFGTARESITFNKLNALERTLIYYQSTHKNLPDALRIDLVAIDLNDEDKVVSLDLVKSISW